MRAVTAPGLVSASVGVAALLGAEGIEVPTEFVAVTVNVYVVPFVSPKTVHVSEALALQVCPPGIAVTS